MTNCCFKVILSKPKSMSVQTTFSKVKLDNIENIIKTLITNQATNDLKKLFDEGALISRMCCKVKKKFRGEKLFRRLKQITVLIKKLFQLNIPEVILNLLSTFEIGMPTKQAGLWAGTRILAALHLIDQLQQFSEGIAQLIVKVLQSGQCWSEMNIAFAMVSRVWILSKSLKKSFLRSYQHYKPVVNQLKTAETEWLPKFELPECFKNSLMENNNKIENNQSESEEELVENPGSVMCRKPEIESIGKKRKRPGKQIRKLQEKRKHKIKVVKKQKCSHMLNNFKFTNLNTNLLIKKVYTCIMHTNDHYMTSYKAAHRIISTVAFESNVSSLDLGKESMPNNPNLKQWNYDTLNQLNHGFKIDTMDPIQKSIRLNVDKIDYMMTQWEKYWSNPPKRSSIPSTEYNDKFISSKLKSNVDQTPTTLVQQTLNVPLEVVEMQTLKISDMGVVRKLDPYVSTQKLAYTEMNPITVKQLNNRQQKKNKIMLPEYKPFYTPIFNHKNSIRSLPNTMNYVPHNSLKTEMSASYKKPKNTLSKFDFTVEIPISISRNPTLSQILSVPGMYTSEYSNIGRHMI